MTSFSSPHNQSLHSDGFTAALFTAREFNRYANQTFRGYINEN